MWPKKLLKGKELRNVCKGISPHLETNSDWITSLIKQLLIVISKCVILCTNILTRISRFYHLQDLWSSVFERYLCGLWRTLFIFLFVWILVFLVYLIMRTIEYGTTTTTHVPAFLTKLWKLVTDVSCNELISWSLVSYWFHWL